MGPANSLHAPAYYSEYNERFDFDLKLNEIYSLKLAKFMHPLLFQQRFNKIQQKFNKIVPLIKQENLLNLTIFYLEPPKLQGKKY